MNTTTSTAEAHIERLDDIPLLLALQQRLGLAPVIDRHIRRHWLHQGLSIGQLIVGWATYILSQADHRQVRVREHVDDGFLLSGYSDVRVVTLRQEGGAWKIASSGVLWFWCWDSGVGCK